MENAFREALDRAVAAGELKRSADTRALARFLVNTLQGLVVLGKGKAPRRSREDVIDVAMRALAA
jgi:TetR/AcrR family transcriptional repressor of nem operon